jgi:hypothetical protein
MAFEKGSDIATDSRDVRDDDSGDQMKETTATTTAFGEAVGIYGNAEEAEKLGYVHRGYVDL